jgi:hypothetical protein
VYAVQREGETKCKGKTWYCCVVSLRVCACVCGFHCCADWLLLLAARRRHYYWPLPSIPVLFPRNLCERSLAGWWLAGSRFAEASQHHSHSTSHHSPLDPDPLSPLPAKNTTVPSPVLPVRRCSLPKYTTRSRARVLGRACMNTSYPPSPYSQPRGRGSPAGRSMCSNCTALHYQMHACLDSRVCVSDRINPTHAWQCSPHVQYLSIPPQYTSF